MWAAERPGEETCEKAAAAVGSLCLGECKVVPSPSTLWCISHLP